MVYLDFLKLGVQYLLLLVIAICYYSISEEDCLVLICLGKFTESFSNNQYNIVIIDEQR